MTPDTPASSEAAPPAPGAPRAPREAVAGPAALVSLATLSSRVAGVARESLFAALFGAGVAADAFVIGFRIPNLLRDLFAEGAFSGAFVPTFARVRARDGDAAAIVLARRALGTLLVVTSVLAVVGIVFAAPVVDVVATRANDETRALAVRLTRIMFPFLPLVAAAAVAMGVLNSHRRYLAPAFSPVAFNLAAIAGGVLLLRLGWSPEAAVAGWAGFVLLGGALQALVQAPSLRAIGWRGGPTADLRLADPDLRAMVRRMAPVTIALAGTQVTIVVTTALASGVEGWVAHLNYAFRIIHLPIGLVGVALGTVALAAASRRAAEGDRAGLEDVVRRGLRLNLFLSLPAAALLAGLAEASVRLLYEHGAFGPTETAHVVAAIRWYCLGVAFYGGIKVATTPFHARGDTKTPVVCSLLGIGANLCVALVGLPLFGFPALPLATAAGAATNYVLLRAFDRRRHGGGSGPGAAFLAKTFALCGGLAVAAFLVGDLLLTRGGAASFPALLGGLGAAGVVLGGGYVVVAAFLGIEEARGVVRRFLPGAGR